MNRRLIALLLVSMLLFPGCLDSSETDTTEQVVDSPETDPSNDVVDIPETVSVAHTDGCDNLNPVSYTHLRAHET